ncbi:MAG TPA: hypothetical protein VGN17_11695 [Bryobacteraceae bacterium]|jgi:hypothetical protein
MNWLETLNWDEPNDLSADIVDYFGKVPDLPPPPLATFRGFLKQIDGGSLTYSQELALSLAAPGFRDRFVFKPQLDALRTLIYTGKEPEFKTLAHLKKHCERRYSGGDDLGRGRYYTVASDSDGQDGLTLISELYAYHSPAWSGEMLMEDCNFPEHAPALREVAKRFPGSIAICLFNSPAIPHRFWSRFDSRQIEVDASRTDLSGHITSLLFALPYKVTKCEIEGVLDLRERTAQEWLTKLVREGLLRVTYIGQEPTVRDLSFIDLLRYLVSPINGGSLVTNVIGGYLRCLGVAGLIYPSARSNNHASYRSGRLIECNGWNFVDYRFAAMDTDILKFSQEVYDLSPEWFRQTTVFEARGERAGSWKRTHVPDAYARVHATDLQKIASEDQHQRSARMRDYRLYWKTVHLLENPSFRSYLAQCMPMCRLNGVPEDISPHAWQYVLSEVGIDGSIPHLADPKASEIPIELRLVGGSLS